jgi:hypothetical protein
MSCHEETVSMTDARTRGLLAAATLMNGILAGTVVDRPVEAVGSTLLLVAALVSCRFDRSGGGRVIRPLVAAVALSVLGLVLTVKAAPIMLSLAAVQSPTVLLHAFDDFFLWGIYLRGAVDVLAFVAAVWALAATHGSKQSRTTKM